MKLFRAAAALVQSPCILSLLVIASALFQGLLAVSLSGLNEHNNPQIIAIEPGWTAEQCRADNGDTIKGVCPKDSTCCPMYEEEDGVAEPSSSFACLPANKHISKAPGICCGRSLLHSQSFTGCPAGYRCAADIQRDGSIREYCEKVANETSASTETTTRILDIPMTPRSKRRLGASHKMSPPYQSSSLTTKESDVCCTNETAANHPSTFPRYFLCNLFETISFQKCAVFGRYERYLRFEWILRRRSSGRLPTGQGSQLLWVSFADANFPGETYPDGSRWVEPRSHMDVH